MAPKAMPRTVLALRVPDELAVGACDEISVGDGDGVVIVAAADDVATGAGGSGGGGALASGTFCSWSQAVAFFQAFSLPSNTHKTSSLFPPAMTANPLGSPAKAKLLLVLLGANVEL
jgi:hypothetical protein